MTDIGDYRGFFSEQSLTFLGGVPYVYHCHHYNLFHDQTIDDAMGDVEGVKLRTKAASNATREALLALTRAAGAVTPVERLQLASALFSWMGHGNISLEVSDQGGIARSAAPHYGYSWKQKYGAKVKRSEPADAFAAGFAAAATEVAFELLPGSIASVETACVATRDAECIFALTRVPPTGTRPQVLEAQVRASVGTPEAGLDEARIAAIGAGLVEFMKGVRGDDRGLVQAFNVFVAAHFASYYNETVYEAVHRMEETNPSSSPIVESLMRESGQVCVFNTFGNILLSPEWEGLVGRLSGDPTDTISFGCAISRGLGFGHWLVKEYEPRKRFVLRATSSYEPPYYLQRYGLSDRPRGYFLQGSALAMMVLAERVDFAARPELTNDVYLNLFRGRVPYRVEQTLCQTRGDACSELVVTAT